MKKLLLIALLSIFSSNSFSRTLLLDNKVICEKNRGTWQIFNNDCANSCESKFSLSVCSSAKIYSCNCGKNRCWDQNKCISDKIAQAYWDEIADKNAEAREEELEILKEKQELFYEELKNKKITPISQPQQQIDSQPTVADMPSQPPIGVNPEIEKINNEKKKICEQQNGLWTQFSNGCVDNCQSQVSKMSMCTMALSAGCECGETKCWDEKQNICVEVEDYKKLMNQPTTSTPTSPIVIEQPNNPLSLNPIDLNSESKIDNSQNKPLNQQ